MCKSQHPLQDIPFPHLSLLPGHLFFCQFVLISVPSSPAWKTPGIFSCFTLINWPEKPMSGLNWHSSFWGDDGGRHQLCFWMEKKQHRSLLVQANRIYSLVNLFKFLPLQPVPQRLEIPLWGHGHQCHLPCSFHQGGEWAQKQPDWINIFCLAESLCV